MAKLGCDIVGLFVGPRFPLQTSQSPFLKFCRKGNKINNAGQLLTTRGEIVVPTSAGTYVILLLFILIY